MKLLIVCLLVAGALAVPVKKNRPEIFKCEEERNRFKEGVRYSYKYEGEVSSGIVGLSEDRTGLKLKCNVEVEVPESCELLLKTEGCVLEEMVRPGKFVKSPTSRQLSLAMSERPLYFRMTRGEVYGVYPSVEEPLQILNVKKGILSSLQVQKVEEPARVHQSRNTTVNVTDIHGNCSANYTVFKLKQGRTVYNISRDLSNCTRPNKTVTELSPLSVLKNITSQVERNLNSTQNCSYEIDRKGQIREVYCLEQYTVLALSSNMSRQGVQTNITVVLKKGSTETMNSKKIDTSLEGRRVCNLTFEFENITVPMNTSINTTLDLLIQLVNTTRNTTQLNSTILFDRFVASLRSLKNESLFELFPIVYQNSTGNFSCNMTQQLARDYLIQALPQCGSVPCISLISHAIMNGTINGTTADLLLYSLAFVTEPTISIINETLKVAKLNRTRPALLSLSTQIYNYYQVNETARRVEEIPTPIRESMNMLLQTISFDCTPFTNMAYNPQLAIQEQQDILIALRAIGNMGFPVQKLDKELRKNFRIVPTLVRCAKNPSVPRNISLAAIQAIRRMEFTPEVRQELMTIVREPEHDVEQRIAAYVMLMKNVTKPDLVSILHTLKREQVNQVRSFISSHLQNVRLSEEPVVRPLRNLVEECVREERILLPEVEAEAMKFSRNYEYSQELFVPYTNISWINRLTSNVVYHPESYLPRQALFNYTIVALGQPINLFELGFDMEGLESIVETFFGNKGYFPDQTLKTVLKSKPKKTSLANNVLETLDELHKEVRHEKTYPQASTTLKVLGNEFGFLTLEQLKNMTIGSENPMKFIDILSKGYQKNLTAAWKFVEARHTIPTIMGLPLNISTNGTLVARASVNVTADLKNLFFNAGRPAYIKTVVVPSATVSVVSRMVVDCPLYTSVGLQMNDTLYHASNFSANVTFQNGELSFHLNNTVGPVQLVNYSRELYIIRPREQLQELTVPRTNSTSFKNCTNTTNVLGVELCFTGEMVNGTYSNVSHFMGSVKSINVTIVPTDRNLTTYSLAMKYEQIKQRVVNPQTPKKQLWRTRYSTDPTQFHFIESLRVNFSAPGQNYTRNVTSLLQLNRNTTELLWNVTVPEVQNVTVWAKISNNSQWWNNTMNYTMTMNVTYAPEKNLTLEWRYLNVTCNKTMTQNHTMLANLTVSNMTYAWSSSVNRTLNSTGNFTANVNVTYYWDPIVPVLDWLKPEYKVKPENVSVLSLAYAYLNKSSENETVWESHMNLTYPFQNITFLARVWNNTANYSGSANLTWLTPANETRYINVSHQLLNSSIEGVTNFTYVFNISYPEKFLCVNASWVNTTVEYNSTLNVTLFMLNSTMYNMSFYNWTVALSMKNVSRESPEPVSFPKWYYEPTSGKYIRKPQPDVWQVKLNLTYPSWFNQSSQNLTLSARLINSTHDHGRNYTVVTNITVPEFKVNATHNMTLLNKTQGIEFFWNTTASANLTLLQNITIFNTSLWNITRLNTTSPLQLQNVTWTGKLNYTWPRNETIQVPLPIIGNLSLTNMTSLWENITMPVYLANYKLPFEIFGIRSIPWLRQVNESMIVRLLNISYFEPKFLEELEPIVGKIEIPLPKMQIIPRPILRLINYTLPNMTIPKNLSIPCLGNLTYEMNLTSPIYNMTVNSTVQNITVARNVSILSGSLNVTSNSSMEFLNFTMQGVLNATHLNNLTEVNVTSQLNLTHPDLTVNVTLNTTCLNITGLNVTRLNSTFLLNVTAPQWVNVTVNVTATNNTLYANLTVPTFNSSVVFLGQLPNKTLLNMTVFVKNITRDINETVLSWFISLNETSMLYSNLTWNLTALNSTMNLTRAIEHFWNITSNQTHPINKYAVQYLNSTVAQCLNSTVNYTMSLVNTTVNYTYELVQNLTVGTPLFNLTFNGTDMIRNITNMITYNTTEFFNRTLPAWMTNFYKYEPITQMLVNYTINATIPQNLTITNATYNVLSYFLFSGYKYTNNSICMNVTTPLNWTSFYELPSWRNTSLPRNKTWSESILTTVYDMIFTKPVYRSLPMYITKTGMIFGNNHVYTFDGRLYSVPEYKHEDCMYVLARDFRDKNFTILSSPESITIKFRELVIRITGDSKVYIDGSVQPTELPYQTPEKNVTITRVGPFVNVTTSHGIGIVCDSVNQACAFNISGLYHNKTLGLLGTSDNEPSTDFRKPNGRNTTSVAEFLNSYEVTGYKTCKISPSQQYNKVAKVRMSKVKPICSQLLNKLNISSPWSKCFKTIDPTPFREACEYDSKYVTEETAYCKTLGSYVTLCQSKGIYINQTAECTICEKTRKLNDTWWQKSKPTADIVLIISESMQMTKRSNPEHQLKKLIQKLNEKMSYKDMRVAIVGFGGKDVHEPAHVHTVDGELFTQMKPSELNRALRELVFTGKKTTNAMEAIKLATQYPFRPEASKIFLLITEEDKIEKNPEEIRSIKKILAEQSITMNVFSSYKEIKKSKVDAIFGIKYNLDIISDKKVPKKHSISGLVKLPKGVYVELCTATKGSIFSVDLLLEGEHRLMKQVSDVVVEQIESQIGTEKICKCYQGPAGEGVTKCKVVPVPFY